MIHDMLVDMKFSGILPVLLNLYLTLVSLTYEISSSILEEKFHISVSTYLRHSYGIWEHLSRNRYLSQALTTGLPAKLSRQLSAMRIFYVNIICGRHILQQDDSIQIYMWNVENCATSICIPCKFEYVGDPWQMRGGPTEADRSTLPVATGDCVAGRSAEYNYQGLLYTSYLELHSSRMIFITFKQ